MGTRDDFYDLSAIKVTRSLPNPRESSYLKVRMNRIPPYLSIDAPRQTLQGSVLTVTKEAVPLTAGYSLPYRGNDGMLLEYLRPEMFIQSEDKELITVARGIIRKTTDPLRAAHMIMDWVFNTIDKVPVVSISFFIRINKGTAYGGNSSVA